MKQPHLSGLLDRRSKLTEQDKQTIISLKESLTIARIAKQFNVSWMAISYTLFPDKLAKNKALRKENAARYYDKDKQVALNKATKEYKQLLRSEGKL